MSQGFVHSSAKAQGEYITETSSVELSVICECESGRVECDV